MSIDRIVEGWKEIRSGLIEEVSQIPADKFSFRATPETRSVAEVLQHVIESQKTLVGEAVRPETNLMRQPLEDHAKEYAPEVAGVTDKNALLELLRSSMETSATSIKAAEHTLNETGRGLGGRELRKIELVSFAISHEMYHRGQLTVYERLLQVEPALTRRFRAMTARAAANKTPQNAS
ncbi:MAG TPA: DinB family protein [Pyrinomonadaceae bacterium]|nr:DinB family protein [Pyrinomonadaceae bacterium]